MKYTLAVLLALLSASAVVSGQEQTVRADEAETSVAAVAVADAQPAPVASVKRGGFDLFEAARRVADAEETPVRDKGIGREGFRWKAAFEQSLLFLAVQHGYALTQPKTRRALRGAFLKDYIASVKSLHGWDDGGRFFTNYVAHPMQGSLMGFVQIQNDPGGKRRKFGASRAYWRSRLKALAWSAAWSTQFEIGPVSQASIGNVGDYGKQTYIDLVVTPTVGLGLLVTEDALDRHVVARIERASDNQLLRIASRMLLNPTRSAANLLRLKKPWYRDAGLRGR
jgi:hypothetical protein